MPQNKTTYIVNPKSGTTAKAGVVERIKVLAPHAEIIKTEFAGHAKELAKTALENGSEIIVAVGGDGSVNEVGSQLINTPGKLGIIPMGSGNGLARHMKIPLNVDDAIRAINEGHATKIDSGSFNDIPFFCAAGTGFDAYISKKFKTTNHRGLLGYIKMLTTEYAGFKPQTFNLTVDDEKIKSESLILSFANGAQYGNNAMIAPHASITDGKLSVVMIKDLPTYAIPKAVVQLFYGTLDKNMNVDYAEGSTIRSEEPVDLIHVDGEPYNINAPMDIRVNPLSLNIIISKHG